MKLPWLSLLPLPGRAGNRGTATALFVPGDSRAGNANIAKELLKVMLDAGQVDAGQQVHGGRGIGVGRRPYVHATMPCVPRCLQCTP